MSQNSNQHFAWNIRNKHEHQYHPEKYDIDRFESEGGAMSSEDEFNMEEVIDEEKEESNETDYEA